jgi:hypothetical protein
MVAGPCKPLAEISEIEAALGVEDKIVRCRQLVVAAVRIEDTRAAIFGINSLDAAAIVVVCGTDRHPMPRQVLTAAVIAKIKRAIRTECKAVRSATGGANRGTYAIRGDTSTASGGNLG